MVGAGGAFDVGAVGAAVVVVVGAVVAGRSVPLAVGVVLAVVVFVDGSDAVDASRSAPVDPVGSGPASGADDGSADASSAELSSNEGTVPGWSPGSGGAWTAPPSVVSGSPGVTPMSVPHPAVVKPATPHRIATTLRDLAAALPRTAEDFVRRSAMNGATSMRRTNRGSCVLCDIECVLHNSKSARRC
jgi:hypothetical protein